MRGWDLEPVRLTARGEKALLLAAIVGWFGVLALVGWVESW